MTYPADDLASLSRFLLSAMPFLRLHEAAAEAVDEITHAVEEVRRVTMRENPERHYRGTCTGEYTLDDQETTACCLADIYARSLDASLVVCGHCGSRHDGQERREWLRQQAGSQLYTRKELPDMLKVLSERVIKDSLLDLWISKGRLATHGTKVEDGEQVGLYLIEDVLFILAIDRPVVPCRTCGDDIVHTGKVGKPSAYCSEDCRRTADAARKRVA